MNVFGIIRIAAVVGLSAIKLVSTALKVKEAKEQGLINPVFANNNSTPYNRPVANTCNPTPVVVAQPVYQQPDYVESRRFMSPVQQPVYQAPFVPAVPSNVYPTTVQNMMSNVSYDVQSRRYNTQPVCPVVSSTYIPTHTLQPTVAQYNPAPVIHNRPMWNNYQQPQQIQPYVNQELQWCNKSYGRMMEERQMQQQLPKNNYGSQIFNWSSSWLRNTGPPNDSGVVPMFYSSDGIPLFGPMPCGV